MSSLDFTVLDAKAEADAPDVDAPTTRATYHPGGASLRDTGRVQHCGLGQRAVGKRLLTNRACGRLGRYAPCCPLTGPS